MTAAKKLEPISIDVYLHGEERARHKHEYIDGRIYAMAGGRNSHNRIAGSFFGHLFVKLHGKPCQPYNSDTKVRVRLATHTRFYYPDGMVVCDSNPGSDTYQDQPVVIAEVLSASTRRVDEGEKRDAYLQIPSLSSYLLIETTSPKVTVYSRSSSGFAATVYEGLSAAIPLDGVKAELSLAELYERIDFTDALAEDEADARDADLLDPI